MNFPLHEIALQLSPSELAGHLLLVALARWRSDPRPLDYRLCTPPEIWRDNGPRNEEVRLAYAEAWNWLLREGLLVPDQNAWNMGPSTHVVPSRRARELRDLSAFERIRKFGLLPRDILDPRIKLKTETDFFLGHYDEATHKAFRAVEIAVRDSSGLADALVGTKLMRQAFDEMSGVLRDQSVEKPEREAMAHLFAGSIGLYRNPTAHREIELTPEKCIELLVLASHLLRVVDERLHRSRPLGQC